ncbi:hypothetical protein ACFFX0_01645 [Citricoccus parietis]|uniref:Uncharacterized protein n=1 Tax=Citricoccus parietis TaxID=592307 RepID=A0ABV5FTH0_9MICC
MAARHAPRGPVSEQAGAWRYINGAIHRGRSPAAAIISPHGTRSLRGRRGRPVAAGPGLRDRGPQLALPGR